MGASYSEKGGGPAVGLGQDWVQWLSQGLNTGTFGVGSPAGGDAMGRTLGLTGVLNDILSGGGGVAGGAIAEMLGRQQTNDVNSLRGRFNVGGGTAYGTPGMNAEASYRAQAAPQITSAISNLQLSALMPLLGMLGQTANKGITQRQGMMTESPFASGLGMALPFLGALAGGPLGGKLGGMFGGGAPTAMSGMMPLANIQGEIPLMPLQF